jgi:hypothetical protein
VPSVRRPGGRDASLRGIPVGGKVEKIPQN